MVISGNNLTTTNNTIISNEALQTYGFKNYIINGGFDVWQRGTSQASSGYGSDDRWINANSGSTKTHSQVACTDTERALFNASYFSRTVVSSVAGAGNNCIKAQFIEDVTKLAGKTVTLSFWAKADSNKNIAIEFEQNFGTGGSPSVSIAGIGAQQVSLTTIWQKKTITVTLPSIIGKTLGTNGINTTSTAIGFWFDAGSNYNTYTNSLGQQSGTFDIAQVQLEQGTVATPFEQRPYGLELSLCQRYYEVGYTKMYSGNSSIVATTPSFKTQKRTVPTLVYSAPPGGISNVQPTTNEVTTIDGFTVNRSGAELAFSWTASAEL